MPPLSTWFVRLSLVYLLAGSTIGSVLLAAKGLGFWPWLTALRSLHVEFLLFGWMVQLAFGVASWILPRTAERAGTRALSASLVLLNAGVWTAAIAETIHAAPGALVGRLLEIGAVVSFAWYIWPRVRAFKG